MCQLTSLNQTSAHFVRTIANKPTNLITYAHTHTFANGFHSHLFSFVQISFARKKVNSFNHSIHSWSIFACLKHAEYPNRITSFNGRYVCMCMPNGSWTKRNASLAHHNPFENSYWSHLRTYKSAIISTFVT